MEETPGFNERIWGEKYWFFLKTISFTYPSTPNATVKRKYYDLMMNFPIFIPNENISNIFINLLDKCPVEPYLCNKKSFQRYIWFIYNKYNYILGKEEISYEKYTDKYFDEYKTKSVLINEKFKLWINYIYIVLILLLLIFIFVYF
jgi:hypothetical protein